MKKAIILLFVAIVAVLGFDIVVNAEGAVTAGPEVSLDVSQGEPGSMVWATVTGFDSSWVTISMCGNDGRRGSPDCNMLASEGAEIAGAEPLVRQLTIVEPPVPCPCIVRVADRTNSVVATASLDIVGHPTGEVVDGGGVTGDVAVSVRAERASTTPLSWLRSELGGATEYEVTVRVRNESTVDLAELRLSGSAGRSANSDLLQLPLDDPGTLGAGQTWEQTILATAPAPSFDDIEWRVFLSGTGSTVSAQQTTSHSPALLRIMIVALVAIVGALVVRLRVRSYQRRAV